MRQSVPLPAGWGRAQIRGPGQHAARVAGTARSYDHAGNQLVWSPPGPLAPESRFACDLESPARDSQARAAQFQLPPEEFLWRWVVAEVLAKLSDTPVLLWVKRYGLLQVEKNPAGGFDWRDCGIVARGLVSGHSPRLPAAMAFGFSCPASPHNGQAIAGTRGESETIVC